MTPIDDRKIDQITWEEIHDSPSKGDFAPYLVYALVDEKYQDKGNAHLREMDDAEDNAPVQYLRGIDRILALQPAARNARKD
ncbi:MAG: hypothetical protein GX776_08875 [Oxalobacter sp.]|nr:hypothetical protein [Oxalobacter sp.]